MTNVTKYAPYGLYGKLERPAVDTDEIKDGVVTLPKLGPDVIAAISGGAGGDVNIPDGADITQGSMADAAWDEVAGPVSIVSILKKAVLRLTTILNNTGNTAFNTASIDTSAATTVIRTTSIDTKLTTTNTNTGNVATATGAQADAAWVSGSGSVVSILKNLAASLASIVTSNSSIQTTNTTLAGSVSGSRVNTNILRTGTTGSVSIASGATDSTAVDISTAITGGFIVPSTMTGSSLTYKASYTTSGFVPLYDQYGNLVTTPISTSQSRAYPFPAEAAGYASLVLVSSAAEGAIRTFNTFKKG